MENSLAALLERSVSQQSRKSAKSVKSVRSGRRKRRLHSQPSSSASSIAASEASLTSFPLYESGSPADDRFLSGLDVAQVSSVPAGSRQGSSAGSDGNGRHRPASMVESLTTTSPRTDALFDDEPASKTKVPGALHQAEDAHIERLMARHGAVSLVRQLAEDLAQRDTQMATLRRRFDDRERVLRKIILECGLSNLELETRLRMMELESKTVRRRPAETGALSDMMTDAMTQEVGHVAYPYASSHLDDATIRANHNRLLPRDEKEAARGATRGWKDLLWGTGTVKRASSVNRESKARESLVKAASTAASTVADRRPTLAEDLFHPPTAGSMRSPSAASSLQSVQVVSRKASLASMALRLVVGNPPAREGDRDRANGAGSDAPSRSVSVSGTSSASARTVSVQGGPKALMAMRRVTGVQNPQSYPRSQASDRWDTTVTPATSTTSASPATPATPAQAMTGQESSGPVEMDTIFSPDQQPPTLTHIYNNYSGTDLVTDRFGFIYDHRRKKRQRQAVQMAKQMRSGGQEEQGLEQGLEPTRLKHDTGSPSSTDEARSNRWQDHLTIATFPTELLSHTPLIKVHRFEVTEGSECCKSPGLMPSEDRGFVPVASTTSAVVDMVDSEARSLAESERSATLTKDESDPVRMLLQNLNQLHDSLQRERTVRWNDFLRKVRAERKREGEMANAAAAAAAEARFQKATEVMPETRVADGELIGVASLGLQGKVGRAKANELRNLILAGIPVAYRASVWSECSGARVLRIPGYYQDLLARPDRQDDGQIVAQIKADITRTLTDNIFFRNGPGVGKLNDVLLAYSRRNTEVGYCQGMNLVAANLLLIMPSAEEAFWMLATMIEQILPRGYFDHSLLASRADQQVLRQYVADLLPRLSGHFGELGIDLETMTFQWFLSVFTDCLGAEALFRVWDVVLCSQDGAVFLFHVALALLKLNEAALLACASPAAVYTYINQQMTNHAISIDGLLHASEGLRRLVRRDEVEARRARAIAADRELILQRDESNAARRASKTSAAAAVPATPELSAEACHDATAE